MSDLAIRVENLSKRYRIGEAKQRHNTLRDQLADGVKSLFSRNGGHRSGVNSVWALKDISFHVEQGEVVGIIGRNGAGKSTLLKILSRITVPTKGRAEIYGRVGSLLEVGTGFHPELSGRENIYLNGAILGMKKKEIDRRFDEIVAFAEVEKFIDTPVKHYSSGMYMRLAFAVAAHLEPEILIVDEVLAVGDAAFQKKCLGKMDDVAKQGRTVLFVSHNIGAISTLTKRCMYFQNGQIVTYDMTREVVERYLMETLEHQDKDRAAVDFYRRSPLVDSPVRVSAIWIDNGLKEPPTITIGAGFTVYIRVQVFRDVHGANLSIGLKNSRGERAIVLFSWDKGFALSLRPGEHVISARVEDVCLSPGQYFVGVGINQSTNTTAYDVIVDFPLFRIVNNGHVTHWLERPWGVVHCDAISWQIVE